MIGFGLKQRKACVYFGVVFCQVFDKNGYRCRG